MKFVLVAIVLLLLFSIVTLMYKTTYHVAEKTTCKASVKANAIRLIQGLDFATSDIRCPPEQYYIDTSDDEEILKTLANATYVCWNKFGEGQYPLFDVSRGSSEKFCIICSYIDFGPQAQGKQLKGYLNYSMTHRIPKYNDARSYYKYIHGADPTKKEFDYASTSDQYFNTSIPHSVLLIYGHEKGFWDKFNVGLATGIAGAVVGVVGTVVSVAGGPVSALVFAGFKVVKYATLGFISAGGLGASLGPEHYENWSYGILTIPYTDKAILEQNCTLLEG